MYLEKEDGRQRPLGVAAQEDKIVQQAVVAILNQIYEEDFPGSVQINIMAPGKTGPYSHAAGDPRFMRSRKVRISLFSRRGGIPQHGRR